MSDSGLVGVRSGTLAVQSDLRAQIRPACPWRYQKHSLVSRARATCILPPRTTWLVQSTDPPPLSVAPRHISSAAAPALAVVLACLAFAGDASAQNCATADLVDAVALAGQSRRRRQRLHPPRDRDAAPTVEQPPRRPPPPRGVTVAAPVYRYDYGRGPSRWSATPSARRPSRRRAPRSPTRPSLGTTSASSVGAGVSLRASALDGTALRTAEGTYAGGVFDHNDALLPTNEQSATSLGVDVGVAARFRRDRSRLKRPRLQRANRRVRSP